MLIHTCLVQGQEGMGVGSPGWTNPIKKKILLSGNFGEPRSGHFHSGIDIKTDGVAGLPVYSVMEGYISRIKIEPGGYGKALYLTHPDGRVSLYGHLDGFTDQVASWVTEQQYKKEAYAVDLYPAVNLFRFKQGDQIAWSGNSGSSMGPHLHFEIRDAGTGNPTNPFNEIPDLEDSTPPVLLSLFTYSLVGRSDQLLPIATPLISKGATYVLPGNTVVALDKISAFGIEAFDLVTGSSNKCGIHRLRLFMNDKLIFESVLDEFSFSETRYVNSFMDYEQFQRNNRPVIRMFIQPNNRASMYSFSKNRGLIQAEAGQVDHYKVVAEDVSGNSSTLTFRSEFAPQAFVQRPDIQPVYNAYFNFSEDNTYLDNNIRIDLPKGALYDDLYFQYVESASGEGIYSSLHQLHFPSVALHYPMRLTIACTGIPPGKENKALVVREAGNGVVSIGGERKGDNLVAQSQVFGTFYVILDTVPPSITPVNYTTREEIRKLKTLKIRIRDNLSGIQSFRGEIDGKYALFEYDSKNNLLEYTFDPARVKPGEGHALRLKVTDMRQNVTEYKVSFDR